MTCDHAHQRIARAADDAAFQDPALDAHLASCAACRAALDEQRRVSAALGARPPLPVSPGFVARVSARLDAEDWGGLLELANWRVWGGGLAPVAAALTLAAWLGVGVDSRVDVYENDSEVTFAEWTRAAAADPDATVFLEPGASADLLLEAVLTGAVLQTAGDPDVR